MENINIRPATFNDLPTLLQFEQGVIATERPFDVTLKKEPTNYYDLQQMISAPHIELLVAELNGKLVGSGYARIERSKPYLQHKQHAYLGFMYVVPEYRGRGVNKAIIAALESWTRTQAIDEMRLEVYAENSAAVKAYDKSGFSALLIQMRKGLEKDQDLK